MSSILTEDLRQTEARGGRPAADAAAPLVSVVIIFLNAERFLQEAIASVFSQTYQRWELLLVDDGSTDQSADLAQRYAAQHPERVQYLEHARHANRGMSASRNLGLSCARGEYIAFLDADDVWLEQKLEKQVAILNAHSQAAMVYGPVQFWFSWTGEPEHLDRDFVTEPGIPPNTLVESPSLLIRLLRDGSHVPLPSSILARRSEVERIGGFEAAFHGLYEDLAFAAKLSLAAPVFVGGECLSRYRQHPDSYTYYWVKTGACPPGRLHWRPHSAQLFFLDWLEQHLSRQGIKHPELLEILQGALWPYRHPILHRLLEPVRHLHDWKGRLLNDASASIAKFKRLAFYGIGGSISAAPNPVQATDHRSLVGVTTLSWSSKKTEIVEVRIGAPDGPLFSRAGSSGSAITGNWVRDGMRFYLQDVSDGRPLNRSHTLATVRVSVAPASPRLPEQRLSGEWDYQNLTLSQDGDDTSYQKGVTFLDGHGAIEDWGCGLAHAKKFVKNSRYIGIDGRPGRFVDNVVDLREYTSNADCILLRHVLEHNHDWRRILANAVASFRKRMAIIVFTPLTETTRRIASSQTIAASPIPEISFRKEDLTEFFKRHKYTEESLKTNTRYKMEHIFYIER
jgi:glycosyltransferase involved in cell wall biosynthesis